MTTQLRKENGVVLLGALGFENAYALAMRRDRAEELGIRTIADLSQHAPQLRIGGDFEFFARSEWQALRDCCGIRCGRPGGAAVFGWPGRQPIGSRIRL